MPLDVYKKKILKFEQSINYTIIKQSHYMSIAAEENLEDVADI